MLTLTNKQRKKTDMTTEMQRPNDAEVPDLLRRMLDDIILIVDTEDYAISAKLMDEAAGLLARFNATNKETVS